MLAVCMTLIDNDKDQTSFEDFYYRNRQIAYAFAYKILNNSALAEEACANCCSPRKIRKTQKCGITRN